MTINHNNKYHFTPIFQLYMMRQLYLWGTGGAVMTKSTTKLAKDPAQDIALFSSNSDDPFYNRIKDNKLPWSDAAKQYWQNLFELLQPYLDNDFAHALAKDSFSRLWELTVVHFLRAHSTKGVDLIKIQKKSSVPDFCFDLLKNRFYVEATCASPGKIAELQIPLTKKTRARRTPITENMERLTAAIREKGLIKYYGEKACGYKCAIESDSGLILAISMSKIDLNNRSNNFVQDLRCIFGFSDMQIPIERDKTNVRHKLGKPYYEHQIFFEKVSNKKPGERGAELKMGYFANEEYSHISAILLSYDGHVFFPGLDQYTILHWKKCRNDFILVHNPFAKTPLPVGIFDVALEVTARITQSEISINILNTETAVNETIK